MEIKKDLLASSKKGSTERETQVLGEVVNLKKNKLFYEKITNIPHMFRFKK